MTRKGIWMSASRLHISVWKCQGVTYMATAETMVLEQPQAPQVGGSCTAPSLELH